MLGEVHNEPVLLEAGSDDPTDMGLVVDHQDSHTRCGGNGHATVARSDERRNLRTVAPQFEQQGREVGRRLQQDEQVSFV